MNRIGRPHPATGAPSVAFLASEFADAAPEQARFQVIPVPMELSVSYGRGTALGPAAILTASQQLEALDGGRVAGAWGIHTQTAVAGPACTGAGGDRSAGGAAEAWLAAIEARTRSVLTRGAVPILLGGEHTVTLGAARALHRLRRRVGFVQFDAHADLRHDYEGSRLSHACVMRRVHELGFPIAQFGTRAYCVEEARFRQRAGVTFLDAQRLAHGAPAAGLLPPDFPDEIYITFDVDALDPAQMPATGTPVPGGLDWHTVADLLETLARGRHVIGGDVVELAPRAELPQSDFAAAWLAYRLMGLAGPSGRGVAS